MAVCAARICRLAACCGNCGCEPHDDKRYRIHAPGPHRDNNIITLHDVKQASQGRDYAAAARGIHAMNHPPVQTVWIGPLTTLERMALASYVAHKHEVHLYTYAPVDAPPGVCVLDGREILPESEIFTYAGESYAGFADMFRWKLLLERGGWWVDTDTICLRALNFPADYVFSSGCTWPDGTNRPNNAAVKMPAGCPAAQYGWEECRKG